MDKCNALEHGFVHVRTITSKTSLRAAFAANSGFSDTKIPANTQKIAIPYSPLGKISCAPDFISV